MISIVWWPLFLSLGLLSLALSMLLPGPAVRQASLITAAVLFGIAVIITIPGVTA